MKEKLYLGGGYYDAPVVWIKEGEKTGVYFIHRDYLRSILQLADPQGNLVEENSFDAWGCRRDAVTQQPYAEGKAPKLLLGRGFTGHEHLAVFGLVNMNARLYDPVLGRFLSPDPYVQFPEPLVELLSVERRPSSRDRMYGAGRRLPQAGMLSH